MAKKEETIFTTDNVHRYCFDVGEMYDVAREAEKLREAHDRLKEENFQFRNAVTIKHDRLIRLHRALGDYIAHDEDADRSQVALEFRQALARVFEHVFQ